jgi:hypothetical protein
VGSSQQEKRISGFACPSKRHWTNEERLKGNLATRRLLSPRHLGVYSAKRNEGVSDISFLG